MPLPGSPQSLSTGENSSASLNSITDADSEGELVTPRPGPSAPEQRTHASLSKPADLTAGVFNRPNSFKEWRTDNIRERLELTDEEGAPDGLVSPSHGPQKEIPAEPAKPDAAHLETASGPSKLQFSNITTLASSPPPSSESSSSRVARSRPGTFLGQKIKSLKNKASSSTPTGRPSEPERTRSVSFHPESYTSRNPPADSTGVSPRAGVLAGMDSTRTASPRGSVPRLKSPSEETESSADETTAMRRRPSANYGTSALRLASDADNTGSSSNERRRPKPPGPAPVSPPQPWYRALADKYGSVELENKGSVARDHLALERTFLAWLRTSLSFASIGIAVTQLFRLSTSLQQSAHAYGPGDSALLLALARAPDLQRLSAVGKPLGAVFLGVAILILLIGFHRYFEAQHYVIRGKFPASRGSVVLVSSLSGLLIVVSFAVVLGLAPSSLDD